MHKQDGLDAHTLCSWLGFVKSASAVLQGNRDSFCFSGSFSFCQSVCLAIFLFLCVPVCSSSHLSLLMYLSYSISTCLPLRVLYLLLCPSLCICLSVSLSSCLLFTSLAFPFVFFCPSLSLPHPACLSQYLSCSSCLSLFLCMSLSLPVSLCTSLSN